MPEFQRSISGPNLGGLAAPSRPRASSSQAATAELASTLISGAIGLYGNYKADQAGRRIGGEGETFQSASTAIASAEQELEGLITQTQDEVGGPVAPEQAEDLRKSVFDNVLNNQKRIQSALSRGLISSTEANARLNVLRNEALSNPLMAPFQAQLDNALYRTTGGSGTFGATAAELEAQARRKGELEALQAMQAEATTLVRSGVAKSEQQALNLIAQAEQSQRNSQFYAEKKARLGLTSQEAYAAGQLLSSQQSASAYTMIADWSQAGGDAAAAQGLQFQLQQEGEALKNAIRSTAFDAEGNLLVSEATLRSQLAEVDQRIEGFTQMLKDQSGTRQLMDVMAQRTAALEYEGQKITMDLAKRAPMLYALKDFQRPSEWYWDFVVGSQAMANTWEQESNPILKEIGRMHSEALNDKVATAAEDLLTGRRTDDVSRSILSKGLVRRGGVDAVEHAKEANPEETLTTLRETPFRIRDVFGSNEWIARARSPEGRDEVVAIISGAARRAVISSMYGGTRREAAEEASARGTTRRRWAVPDISIPTSVTVRPRPQGQVRSNIPGLVSGGRSEWIIDTNGASVTDEYKSELVNAYKFGTAAPQLWEDDFESIDAWINHLFARPVRED